jgi:peptidoglycan hydrolase-like protein with peptidoglycan-binding domain
VPTPASSADPTSAAGLPSRTRSGASRAFGALSATLVAVPVGAVAGAAPAHAVVIPAPPTKRLPAELDVAPPYQQGRLCLPDAKPGPIAFAKLLNDHYGARTYGIVRPCAAEHGEGRALDWMINAGNPDQLALGNAITRWLSATDSQGRQGAMARRFGINYIIWNRQIWRAYRPAAGWSPYTGSSPHTDHIHITFTWDGAYQRTSWWTGKALTTISNGPPSGTATTPVTVVPPVTATASGYPLLKQGATGPDVVLAQRVIGASPDGEFGPLTAAALGAWQSRNGVPATKVLDNATWLKMIALKAIPARTTSTTSPATATPPPTATSLSAYSSTVLSLGSTGPAVKAAQQALGGLTPDGEFGPLTLARVRAYQSAKGLPVNGIINAPVWSALMGRPVAVPTTPTTTPKPVTPPPAGVTTANRSTEFTALKQVVLRQGSRGNAVKTLQSALGGLVVDGVFGSRTTAAVQAFQRANGLPASGVVTEAMWTKLEQQAYTLKPYWNTVLKRGSTGPAVIALQRALRIPADGVFGPQTEAAVKAAQAKARLAQTGVVSILTWQAIGPAA